MILLENINLKDFYKLLFKAEKYLDMCKKISSEQQIAI